MSFGDKSIVRTHIMPLHA